MKARVVLFTVLVMVVALISALPAIAQEDQTDTKWLFDIWEGESRIRQAFAPQTKVRIEFKEKAGEIRFETLLTSSSSFVHGSRARGTAKVSADAVAMQGEYYAGGLTGGVSYFLTRKGDLLDGTGIGGGNIPFSISLRKVKQ